MFKIHHIYCLYKPLYFLHYVLSLEVSLQIKITKWGTADKLNSEQGYNY